MSKGGMSVGGGSVGEEEADIGVSHPDTVTIMGNLAATYWQQGRTKDACELQEEVFQKSKEILGVNHPSTLSTMNNLALTYRQQGQTKDACELQEESKENKGKIRKNKENN